MVLNEKSLTEIVLTAMQQDIPEEYATLKRDGNLDKFVSQRVKAGLDTYHQMRQQGMNQVATSGKPDLNRYQDANELERQASKTAISQAIEFDHPNEETTSRQSAA